MLKPKPNSEWQQKNGVSSALQSIYFERMEPKILLSADALSGLIAVDPFNDNDVGNSSLDINQSIELLNLEYQSNTPDPQILDLDALSGAFGNNVVINDNDSSIEVLGSLLDATNNTDESRLEILFIDAATPDYQQLLEGVNTDTADTRYQIFILQSDRDGVTQISETLSDFQQVDAVHLISHGNQQGVQLGNTWLDESSLENYQQTISAWSDALQEGADFLIYGCNLAASDSGLQLISDLAELTGTDVAASDDLTGSEVLGGDWDLEHSVGDVETQVVITPSALFNWSGLLEMANLSATQDSYIDIDSSTATQGDSSDLKVDQSGPNLGDNEALLQFDLSSIPTGAIINSATLNLYAVNVSNGFTIDVYEVTSAWNESTVSWDTAPSYQGDADPLTAPIVASLTFNGDDDVQHSWDITTLAQDWLDGIKVNNGVLLGYALTGTENVKYASSESTNDPTPVLVINYTPLVDANNDSYATNENTTLTVAADGVLQNDTMNVPATVTPGAVFEYLAWNDTDGNNVWEDEVNLVTGFDFDFSTATVIRDIALGDAPAAISAAYVFDGTTGGGQFAEMFDDLVIDRTGDPMSIEFWIRPSDAIGTEIIFNTGETSGALGGRDGASLVLNGSNLEWMIWDNGNTNWVAANLDISAEISSGEFIQVVASFETGTGTASLSVNGGTAVTASNATVNDWSSSGATAIGQVGSGTYVQPATPTTLDFYEGEIAAIRMYTSALSDAEIKQNYDAMFLEVDVASSDVTSAAGATVGINADGSFSYDPGTVFDYLAAGVDAIDTFSYTAINTDGVADTATVSVTVNGVNDAPTGGGSLTTTNVLDNANNVKLFSGINVNDVDVGENDLLLRITLSDPDAGSIGGGFSETFAGSGVYEKSTGMTVAQANNTLDNAAFWANSVGGTSSTLTITVEVDDGTSGPVTVLNATTFTITPAANTAPVLPVYINEIHYDNAGVDVDEKIEIMGPAGTILNGWSLVLYNGTNGEQYHTEALIGTIGDQADGFGTRSFAISGIQNGLTGPDGIALVNSNSDIVQFLSYEGVFTATDGIAFGMTSTDIGVSQDGFTIAGNSLQLTGNGSAMTWQAESANSFDNVNAGQSAYLLDSIAEDTDKLYTHAEMLALLGVRDFDDVDADLIIQLSNSANGTITLGGTATGDVGTTFTFRSDPNFNGLMTFDYQVFDDNLAASDIGSGAVKITAVNDNPAGSVTLNNAMDDNDGASTLFSAAAVSDVDVGENDLTLRITLSNTAAGTISGGGFVETFAGSGIYENNTGLSVTDANTQLALVQFTPSNNTASSGTLVTNVSVTVNDQGAGGDISVLTPSALTVTLINDNPAGSVTLNNAMNDNDGASTLFSAAAVSDVDVGENDLTVRITLSNTAAGSISGGGFVETFAGSGIYENNTGLSVTDANTQLALVQFTPTNNTASSGTLATNVSVTVNDQSAGGDISVLTPSALTVTLINDNPAGSVTLNNAMNDNAGASTLFSAAAVSDADVGENDLTLRITLSNTAAGTISGGGFVETFAGSGIYENNTGLSVTDANAQLALVQFTPSNNTASSGTLVTNVSVTVNDQSGGGDISVLTPSALTVTLINDNPAGSVTLNNAMNDNAGASALFSVSSISDVDVGENDLTVRITLSNTAAGTISGGGFVETFAGSGIYENNTGLSVTDANTQLALVQFTPSNNTASSGTLVTNVSVTVNDQGAGGDISVLTPSALTVTLINDNPAGSVTLNNAMDDSDGASTLFSASSISDVDVGENDLTLRITLSNTAAGTISGGGFVETFAGSGIYENNTGLSVTDANTQLALVQFTPTNNTASSGTLATNVSVTVNDQSGGGDISVLTPSALTVTLINDNPAGSVTLNNAMDDNDGASTLFSAAAVSDADVGENDLTLRITLSNTAAGTISGGGFVETFAGSGIYENNTGLSVTDANTQLALVQFTPTNNTASSGTLVTNVSVTVNDQGAGGDISVLTPSALTVTLINDNPAGSVTLNNAMDDNDGASTLFSAAAVSDADVGENDLTLRITLSNTAAGTISGGGFVETFAGSGIYENNTGLSVTDANTQLALVQFTPSNNTASSGTLVTNVSVTVNDQGAGGDISVLTPSALTVTLVNDSATVSSDTQTLIETDAVLTSSGTLTSSDADNTDNSFTANTIVGSIGSFSIDAAGAWSFTANSAFDNLNASDSVNETYNVSSVDGTTSTVKITINGSNDAATVSSDVIALSETDAVLSSSGSLTSSDADNTDNSFTANTIVGSIGSFSIDAAGAWSFSANSAFDNLNAIDSVNETYNVSSVDGTTSTVKITINGSNDAATVSSDVNVLTETDAVLTSSGTLTSSDDDNANNSFTASSITGTIGDFSIDAAGAWNFTANSTFDNLNASDSVTETYNVTSVDGTASTVKVTINGTNDAATVTSDTRTLIETDAVLTSSGTLTSSDDDNANNSFTASSITGTIGDFSINAAGAWNFTANSAFDNLTATDSVTETYNVTSVDGTTSTVQITINGTNDAATVSSDSKALTETNAVLSSSGTLTSTDADNADNTFTANTIVGAIGSFSIDATGAWSFTANSAFDNLNATDSVNETYNVTSVDGTASTVKITINGTNDTATVSSDSQTLTETDAVLSSSGTLTSTDADNADNTFTANTIMGAIGSFSIDATGAWSFTANSAFDNLNATDSVNETYNVTSVDGTASTVKITINGTNDTATVSSDSQTLTETDAVLSSSGTLTSTDADNADNSFTANTIVGTIGSFSIDAAGAWSFTANSAFDNLSAGDSVNETYNVTSVDGTASTVNIVINGSNDASTGANIISSMDYDAGDSAVALNDIVISDVDNAEIVTATLTLANVSTGTLSSNDGAIYNATTGLWSITGTVSDVNLALANLSFIPAAGNVLDSTIAVSIDDGDEDSSGPLIGALNITVNSALLAEEAITETTTDSPEETSEPEEASTEAETEVEVEVEVIKEEVVIEAVSSEKENDEKLLTEESLDAETSILDVLYAEEAAGTNEDIKDDAKTNINEVENEAVTNKQQGHAAVMMKMRDQFAALNDPFQLIGTENYVMRLNEMRQELVMEQENTEKVVGGSLTVSAGFSVGYVVWLARSGIIMSSVLSSMPAWRFIDPLPVLASLSTGAMEDEESLEDMVGKANENENEADEDINK